MDLNHPKSGDKPPPQSETPRELRPLIGNATEDRPNFWYWLFIGTGAGPGYQELKVPALPLHLLVGIVGTVLMPEKLSVAAQAVLLPLSAILFASITGWIGFAHNYVNSKAARIVARNFRGRLPALVYSFYLAQLVILLLSFLWFAAAIRLGDPLLLMIKEVNPTLVSTVLFSIEVALLGGATLAVEIFWRTIHASAAFVIAEGDIANRLDDLASGDDRSTN